MFDIYLKNKSGTLVMKLYSTDRGLFASRIVCHTSESIIYTYEKYPIENEKIEALKTELLPANATDFILMLEKQIQFFEKLKRHLPR